MWGEGNAQSEPVSRRNQPRVFKGCLTHTHGNEEGDMILRAGRRSDARRCSFGDVYVLIGIVRPKQ